MTTAPLFQAVTQAVYRADTAAALRDGVCDAAVDAGHDYACFLNDETVLATASTEDASAPDFRDGTPPVRSTRTAATNGAIESDAIERVDVSGSAVTSVARNGTYSVLVPVVSGGRRHGTFAVAVNEDVDDADRDRFAAVGAAIGQGLARITEQRARGRLEETLREERRQFEKLHSVAAQMVGCDLENSIYILAIDAAENILDFDICGIDVEEDGYLVPKVTSSGMAPDDSQKIPADRGVAGETFQENKTVIVDDVGDYPNAEPANPDYQSVLSVPIDDVGVFQAGALERGAFSPGDAELVELLMAHVSATLKRLRSEDALRESEEKYRTVIEQSHDAIAICRDDHFEFVNQRATELFGRGEDALLDADLASLFHREDRPELERIYADLVREAGRQETFDARIQRPDGGVRHCEFSATSITYDGEVAVLASIRDITERKEHERELERQNERLEEFASVVSHDLRSPINVARGSVDLARQSEGDGHLERAEDALDRMESLVEDILDLARQGQHVDETEEVALGDVARDAWQTVDAPNATLDVTGDATLDADPHRLQQLFENLFRNAVEHASTSPRSPTREDAVENGSTSPRSPTREDAVENGSTSPRSPTREDAVENGGGEVTVTVAPTDDGFCVADDGSGIPEDVRGDVFERGVTSADDGTGFGLAIVRNIVEAHGWDIAVEPGESAVRPPDCPGACFHVTGCRVE